MPLNWSIEKVQDWRGLHADQFENDKTQTIVFLCMSVDLSGITQANAEEFFQRLLILETVYGPYMHNNKGEPYRFTWTDIKRRIGLSTNCSDKTRAAWNKKQIVELRWRAHNAMLASQSAALPASELVQA